MAFDQRDEQIERLRRQVHRLPGARQKSLGGIQAIRTEVVKWRVDHS